MKRLLKVIAIFLSVLTLMGVFSVANPVIAAEIQDNEYLVQNIEQLKTQSDEEKFLSEIVSERDKYTKVFQNVSGTKTAVVSATPIHYRTEKGWEDIDNTLVEYNDTTGNVYRNKKNNFTATIPKEFSSDKEIKVEKNEYSISFVFDGTDIFSGKKKVKGNIKSDNRKNELHKKDDEINFTNKKSDISFDNVGENTSIEYSVTSTGLKENIILKARPSSKVEYKYKINSPKMNAELNKDKSVSFTNSEGEMIFEIPAPVMYDVNNTKSFDVNVALSGKNGKYVLIYEPSYEWLIEEAVYPVVIDPVIETEKIDSSIVDSYISSEFPNSNMGESILAVTLKENNSESISFYNIASNFIYECGTKIKSVLLAVHTMGIETGSLNTVPISACSVTSEWSESTITYNNRPSLGAELDREPMSASDNNAFYLFDVTEGYLSGSEMYGVALKQTVSSTGSGVCFATAENTEENLRPYFIIEYYESQGVEEQYDYHSIDVGRAGNFYMNDFTNQVTIEREEIGLSGLHMPVTIKRYFNSGVGGTYSNTYFLNHNIFNVYGYGWRTNYNQTIEYHKSINDAEYILYCDGDGQTVYFEKTDQLTNNKRLWQEMPDQFSNKKGYSLFIPEEYTGSEENNFEFVTIEDDNKQIYEFNSNGFLTKIRKSDTASTECIEISYTEKFENEIIPANYIDKIIDGYGREYRFSYTKYEEHVVSLLTSIQLYNSAGDVITVKDDDNNDIPLRMRYSYSFSEYNGSTVPVLSTVTYPDGEIVRYNLTDSLISAQNIDGYTVELTQNTNSVVLSEKVCKENSNVVGNSMTITQISPYEKTYTDLSNVSITKQFDLYGRTIGVIESNEYIARKYSDKSKANGVITYGFYNSDENESQNENEDLVMNGDFSSGLSSWSVSDGSQISIDSNNDCEQTAQTKGALKIRGTEGGAYCATQTITVDNGVKNDEYNLNFFVKNIDSHNITAIIIDARDSDNTDDSWDNVCLSEINPYNENWQKYSMNFTVNKEYDELKVSLIYYFQYGQVWFDNLSLKNTYKALPTSSDSGSSDSSETVGNCSCDYCADNCSCEHNGETVCTPETCPDCGTCTCKSCTQLNCSCRDCSENCTLTSCKRGYAFENTDEGVAFSISDGEKSMSAGQAYYGNYVGTYVDVNGNTTEYAYNQDNGQLEYVQDYYENKTNFSYDAMSKIKSVSAAVNGTGDTATQLTTSYSYEDDRISSIEHNGFSYNYEYDMWGNKTSVKVGQQPLVQYSYGSGQNRDRVNKITYANGDYINYTYTDNGNITEIKSYSSDDALLSDYVYSYNESGSISKIKNTIENTEIRYTSDGNEFVLLNGVGDADDETLYTKSTGDNGEVLENIGNMLYTKRNTLPVSDSETGTTTDSAVLSSATSEYSFGKQTDYFGRTQSKNVNASMSVPEFSEEQLKVNVTTAVEYGYKDLSEDTTTSLVASYKSSLKAKLDIIDETLYEELYPEELEEQIYNNIEYLYSYDRRGNIIKIEKKIAGVGDTIQTTVLSSYVYDGANQLIRENNFELGKTFVYTYDQGGNISQKTEYAATEGELGAVVSTVNFGYDNVWKDKLVSYGDTQITTDALGNPTNTFLKLFNGDTSVGTLEWNGRQLTAVNAGDQRFEYTYNSDGQRTMVKSYVDNELEQTFYYFWENQKLMGYIVKDATGSDKYIIKMLYDNSDDSIGYELYDSAEDETETMYFQKNLQGDITGVYNFNYGELLTYTYDAWGNVTVENPTFSVDQVISTVDALLYAPITYRGYMYDVYTGLYYHQSRYYNPAYGRFLNVDDTDILEVTQGTSLGANLFAYCNNNPVMNVDYSGESSLIFVGGGLASVFTTLLPWVFYIWHTYNSNFQFSSINIISRFIGKFRVKHFRSFDSV